MAASAKLSIKLNISFSNNDCSRCFFFLSFCYFLWVCLKEEYICIAEKPFRCIVGE